MFHRPIHQCFIFEAKQAHDQRTGCNEQQPNHTGTVHAVIGSAIPAAYVHHTCAECSPHRLCGSPKKILTGSPLGGDAGTVR